jgi:hypothetical protein
MVAMFDSAREENLHSNTNAQSGALKKSSFAHQLIASNRFQTLHASSKCTNTRDYETFCFERSFVIRGDDYFTP